MGNDPESKYWKSQRLLLMHLQSPLILKGATIDFDIITMGSYLEVIPSVDPGHFNNLFLTFPFESPALTIINNTLGLTIFDHPFFKFENKKNELQSFFILSILK